MRGLLETYYNLKIPQFRTGAIRQNMDTVHAKKESKGLHNERIDMPVKLAEVVGRNSQLEKELEILHHEYDEKEREWKSESTELKKEVTKLHAVMEAILEAMHVYKRQAHELYQRFE
jgi:intermediate filament protein if